MASASPTSTRRLAQLGEFELDRATGELRKGELKVRLQEQPLKILELLLEQPGELVSREQIQQRLWPDGTFVEFEHSVNAAVKRLREALGDSVENPRFIETLPRRGYRLVVPVEKEESARAIVSPGGRRCRLWVALGAVLVLAASAPVVWRQWRLERSQPVIGSLAVLPLENLSGNPQEEYFADAMTEALITELGQIPDLRVISRTSTMLYKGTHKPLRDIARELKVDAVVEGAVLRSGDQVRITAQLVHASTDRHLWAQTYQGRLNNILGLQDEAAGAIALHIRKKFVRTHSSGAKPARSIPPEAYELFLRGLSQPLTVDGYQRKIRHFEQAVRLQPDYAEAYAELGYAYLRLGHMVALSPQEAFSKAAVAANNVLEIDPSLHHGHVIAGNVKFLYEWDFAAAEKEMKVALELDPNSVYSHHAYADFLVATGRPEEAIAEVRLQKEIDPLDLSVDWQMAGVLYMTRAYDEAITQARKVLAQDPNNWAAHLWLGLALEQKSDFPAATEELKKAAELSNDQMWIGFVAHGEALSGDNAAARDKLKRLQSLARRTYVSPWWMAVIYTGLGDNDQAFAWLQKAYYAREHDLAFSNAWPIFDSLHSDPRYQDLIRRVGLPPARNKPPVGGPS